MAFDSYANLKTAIANWLARDDLTTPIVDFVSLAELQLRRKIRAMDIETTGTLTTVAGTATVAHPTRFIQARSLWIDDYKPLEYRTPDQANFEYEDQQSRPRVYTTTGSTFRLWPVPDGAYTINIIYMAYPEVLSDSNTTNTWLTELFDGLLYGALVESGPYIGQDERMPMWQAMFDRAVANFEVYDENRRYPKGGVTPRIARRVY